MVLNKKYYRSEAFVDRIQMNLANISGNADDEFKLIAAYYDPMTFDCELCGHKNCLYAYEVENLKTEKVLKVGSECIHHFKDKGVDINLAEGLMKRVISATAKARKELIMSLGKDAYNKLSDAEKSEIRFSQKWQWMEDKGKELYKAIPKIEKRDMVIEQFMIIQAKELLYQVKYGKHYLTESETEKIVDLGLNDELEKAEEFRAKYN